jgi:Zn-dependent metalloprotease
MRPDKLFVTAVLAVLFVAAQSTAGQPKAFVKARADLAADTGGAARVVVEPATSRARLIQVPTGSLHLKGSSSEARARDFFVRYGDLLGIADAERDLEPMKSTVDRLGMTHLSYRQVYEGVPVFGAELRAHFDRSGELAAVNGSFVPNLALDSSPTLPLVDAIAAASAVVAKENGLRATDLETGTPKLFFLRTGLVRGVPGTNHLVWEVEVSALPRVREFVYVDAHRGVIVDRIAGIHEINRTIRHETFTNQIWAEGDPLPFTGLSEQGDAEVNELVAATGETFDLFSNITGGAYLSYDGNDRTMNAIYAPSFLDCPNAAWDGRTTSFCVDVTADDTVGHEWTHAYTEFTHNLIYQWQPGALNESYSDIFGELVDMLNQRGLDEPSGLRNASGCSVFGGSLPPRLTVHSPASVTRDFVGSVAAFNPLAPWTVSATLEPADDGTDTASDACETLASFPPGHIALIDRGSCFFRDKVINAIEAGAVAAIIANNDQQNPDDIIPMGGDGPRLEIPALMISYNDGVALKAVLDQGVEATLVAQSPGENSLRWLSSEDDPAFGGAIRDMWHPECFDDPGRVSSSKYWCSTGDNGGVHTNSGVPNHAFALLVDGSTYNGQTIAAIGMTKAAHIYWRAMSVYQGPTTDFAEHADVMELSCADLIGQPITSLATGATISDTIDAFDCKQVAKTMSAVDMRAQPLCDFDVVLQQNPPTLPAGKVVFSENFSSHPGSDWTISSEGVFPEYDANLSAWQWTNDFPPGGDGGAFWAINSSFIGNCEPNDDDQSGVTGLESPAIEIPASAAGATLAFDHWLATENGWDGGNLKISVNGGEFQLVSAEAFLFNPYNSSVIASVTIDGQPIDNTNPLAGETAYTGTDEANVGGGSWGQSQIDLDFFAQPGDSVRLRWDFGIDGCTGFEGWYVDNVRVIAEGKTPLAVRRANGRRVAP